MSSTDEFEELRQGDWLVGVSSLSVLNASGGVARQEATPLGVVVLTQCCDLAKNDTGVLHVAPVVPLEGKLLADAKAGKTSRYGHLEGGYYIDLAIVGTLDRDSIAEDLERTPLDTQRRVALAGCIARRYSRFAYPGDIVEVLRPLSTRIREKALKSGAIGEVLQRVVTMRLECEPDWDAPAGLSLTLLVLVSPKFLPSLGDIDFDAVDAGPKQMRKQGLNGAAEALLKCEVHSPQTTSLWEEFGDELLALFREGLGNAPPGYIEGVLVEVLRTDEINFERYRNTVDLDFDYLSNT